MVFKGREGAGVIVGVGAERVVGEVKIGLVGDSAVGAATEEAVLFGVGGFNGIEIKAFAGGFELEQCSLRKAQCFGNESGLEAK